MNEGSLSLTHNLDRPILEISGFRYVVPGTAPGLNCLAMNVGETRYNLLRLSSWLYFLIM